MGFVEGGKECVWIVRNIENGYKKEISFVGTENDDDDDDKKIAQFDRNCK